MASVRRPDLATEYVAPPYVAPDELPPDFMALLSLLCGLVGICIKVCVSTCVLAYSACMHAAVTRQSVEGGVTESAVCAYLSLQWKMASWLALYACMSSVANVKKSQADYKQIFCSVM